MTPSTDASEEIKRLKESLRERIKELTGLCSMGKLTDETNDLDEIFQRFVREIVPPSIQFPERTFAKIEFDGNSYTNFEKEPKFIKKDGLHAPILVMGKQRGSLFVSYTEDSSFIAIYEQNLINGYAEWLGKIVERIEALQQVITTRDQLMSIINSASELIVSINKEGTITNWNSSIANFTGAQKRDILRKSIYQKNLPNNLLPLMDIIAGALKKSKGGVFPVQLQDKNNTSKTIICSISLIKGIDEEIEGILMIARDVSSHISIHKQVMPSNSYIIFDKTFVDMAKTFEAFKAKGYNSLFISRDINYLLQAKLSKECKTLLLASKDKTIDAENRLDGLINYLSLFLQNNKKSFIIFDRLDYLCSLYGFNEVIKFLYQFNDLIRIHESILILNISNLSFDEQEKSRLNDEFMQFPEVKDEKPYIDSRKIEVLRFIASKNSFHHFVYYEMIRSNFSISKKLTKKWINELEHDGLVRTEQNGRRKEVNVTEKGLSLI